MNLNMIQQAATYSRRRKRNSIRKKITMILASAVVFCTTYALILPAITMERDTICGLEAHIHDETCYAAAPAMAFADLSCSLTAQGIHCHDASCLDEHGQPVCGYADFVLHRHDAVCYDAGGQLQCELPEIEAYVHDRTCWQQPHEHGESCYTAVQGELLCQMQEGETHVHEEACYTARQSLICAQPEVVGHIHDETCLTEAATLTCTLPETEGHAHTGSCLDGAGIPVCELEESEGHLHDSSCYETAVVSICKLPQMEGHSHGEECYETTHDLTCAISDTEPHSHEAECYQWDMQLTCDQLTAQEGAQPALICGKAEIAAHVHEDACFTDGVLTCGQMEVREHVHTENDCYQMAIQSSDVLPISCGREVHIHEESCYPAQEDGDGEPTVGSDLPVDICCCGIAEHSHATEYNCYAEDGTLMCTMTEHCHDWVCDLAPSDSSAVEMPEDWEADLPQLTGRLAEDLIAVAESQLGYEEIKENYIIWEDEQLFYSRYSAWWDETEPYGDWNAKFVVFCLEYAGVSEFPLDVYPADWADTLDYFGLWHPGDEIDRAIPADLVFFDNDQDGVVDAVGILSRIDFDSEELTVIMERSGRVRTRDFAFSDKHIAGYVRIPGNTESYEGVQVGYIPVLPPDVSQSPAFYISAVYTPPPAIYRTYTLRNGSGETGDDETTTTDPQDLKTYLEKNGGSFFFTIFTNDNKPLDKDEQGNYIATAETSYKLALSIERDHGIPPGTYTYQLPLGLTVVTGNGVFTIRDNNNEEVGQWSVDERGLITMTFNKNMNDYTHVIITAIMGVKFEQSNQSIKFDGNLNLVVEEPSETEEVTEVGKWGEHGDGSAERPDKNKIYWTILLMGHKDSQIPGGMLLDILTAGNHTFSESDRQYGLVFSVAEPNPDPFADAIYHSWTVPSYEITWHETSPGWTYTIPETVMCNHCGELELGNEGWTYLIKYTTTLAETGVDGLRYYENGVTFEEQSVHGGVNVQHGTHNVASVYKDGAIQFDKDGMKYLWNVQVTVPGLTANETADYYWFFQDAMDIIETTGNWSTLGYVDNTINLSSVKAIYDGQIIDVPRIQDATKDDLFAWHIDWYNETSTGVKRMQQIRLLSRCQCTTESCQYIKVVKDEAGNDKTENDKYWYTLDQKDWYPTEFCKHWTMEKDTTFVFNYETTDISTLEQYGGNDNRLRNSVVLYKKPAIPDSAEAVKMGETGTTVAIPDLLKKDITHDFDGKTAHYTITVNEPKISLAGHIPITIHDTMSETLAYIGGSLVIKTEDKDGNTATLTQGEDYNVIYDGSGKQTEGGVAVHVLDIEILDMQSVKYTLDYDTTLIIPEKPGSSITYGNSASISLGGETISTKSEQKVYADFSISAKSYKVQVVKTDAATNVPLPGAVFGLYNQHDILITKGITDANGELLFETNVTEGIVLLNHTPYYVQEITAPPGYAVDDTKHWFLFCDDGVDGCVNPPTVEVDYKFSSKKAEGETEAKPGTITVTNQLDAYELPATGSSGHTKHLLLYGLLILVICTGLLCRKRYKGRRIEGE